MNTKIVRFTEHLKLELELELYSKDTTQSNQRPRSLGISKGANMDYLFFTYPFKKKKKSYDPTILCITNDHIVSRIQGKFI